MIIIYITIIFKYNNFKLINLETKVFFNIKFTKILFFLVKILKLIKSINRLKIKSNNELNHIKKVYHNYTHNTNSIWIGLCDMLIIFR
jgi:hypothetical protein